jgi:hypothetical protein
MRGRASAIGITHITTTIITIARTGIGSAAIDALTFGSDILEDAAVRI